MTKSEAALKEACILAEKMYHEKLNEAFDAQLVLIPEDQHERIRKLIYGLSPDKKSAVSEKSGGKKFKRLKTVILVAAILIVLFSVTATAFAPLREFFVRIYRDCTEIVFEITDKNDYLEAEYSYIPQGYKPVKNECLKSTKTQYILLLDSEDRIMIRTLKNKHSSTFIDTENAETGEVLINGQIGHYSITETSIMLVWSTGKYNHCISADLNGEKITIETLIKIAQSRRPAK